jgi:hypothetical protein
MRLYMHDFADRGRGHLFCSATSDIHRRCGVLEQFPQGCNRGLGPRQIILQALQMGSDEIVARLHVGR